MREKLSAKGIWEVLKASFKGFGEDKLTKLSGSLAYYTVFSMGPLMIVIIFLGSIFLGQDAIQGKIFYELQGMVGADTALQVQEIIKNASLDGKTNTAAIIGVITLLVGATTVFAEIQDSINSIWGIKAKPKKGWLKFLQNRFLSFSVIASLGFILIVSLALTSLVDLFSKRLQSHYPDVAVIIFYIINQVITLALVSTIFAVVFKVLPDAKIKWRDVISGAVVTALLFMVGKFLISFYINKTEVGSTYGAAGSLVVLLLWTYYSSLILYFGAEFTKAYAVRYGSAIHPNDYAVTTKQVEVEMGKKTIQQKEDIDPASLVKKKPAGTGDVTSGQ
ncbi:MAG: YihY/virulence factor BrkB family protein [Chitinophagaceae bacterium]|nr:MAG: YihY/virulence factor BrkB family protein [Chitinophagaceae bacterium]